MVDDDAVDTLDQFLIHENFTEFIEGLEKDLPKNFLDSPNPTQEPNCDVVKHESANEAEYEKVGKEKVCFTDYI